MPAGVSTLGLVITKDPNRRTNDGALRHARQSVNRCGAWLRLRRRRPAACARRCHGQAWSWRLAIRRSHPAEVDGGAAAISVTALQAVRGIYAGEGVAAGQVPNVDLGSAVPSEVALLEGTPSPGEGCPSVVVRRHMEASYRRCGELHLWALSGASPAGRNGLFLNTSAAGRRRARRAARSLNRILYAILGQQIPEIVRSLLLPMEGLELQAWRDRQSNKAYPEPQAKRAGAWLWSALAQFTYTSSWWWSTATPSTRDPRPGMIWGDQRQGWIPRGIVRC